MTVLAAGAISITDGAIVGDPNGGSIFPRNRAECSPGVLGWVRRQLSGTGSTQQLCRVMRALHEGRLVR